MICGHQPEVHSHCITVPVGVALKRPGRRKIILIRILSSTLSCLLRPPEASSRFVSMSAWGVAKNLTSWSGPSKENDTQIGDKGKCVRIDFSQWAHIIPLPSKCPPESASLWREALDKVDKMKPVAISQDISQPTWDSFNGPLDNIAMVARIKSHRCDLPYQD